MFKKQHLALAIAATLAAGAAQAALETSVTLKNETARFIKDGIRTGEATSKTDTTGAGKSTFKFENTAKIFLNDELENGNSWHGELNIVRDTKAINDYQGHETNTQRDWLRELYVDTTLDDWDLRIGKQQVVWGTADGIKLLDMINPTDWSEFNQNAPADARIPIWMINAERYLDNGANIQAVLSESRPNKIAGLNSNGDSDHPFVMKGVDTLTGSVNGFYNIGNNLADVAATFNGLAFNFGTGGLAPWGSATVDGFANNTGAGAAFGAACAGYGVAGGGAASSRCLEAIAESTNDNATNLIDAQTATTVSGAAAEWDVANANSTFEYMANTTFATFNTFSSDTAQSGSKSALRTEWKTDYSDAPNLGFRFKNTTANGLNYSLNYLYHYDNNPRVGVSFHDASSGLKLETEIREAANQGGSMYGSGDVVARSAVPTNLSTQTAVTVLLKRPGTSIYYGAQNPFAGGTAADGVTTATLSSTAAKLRFTEDSTRVNSLGGSFDFAIDTESAPVVIRGEFLYDKDANQTIMNKTLYSVGDIEGAFTNQKADYFKYVLGADVNVLTDMMLSGQFIQWRNLDYVNNPATCTTENGDTFSCGSYTADTAVMSASNGYKRAEENKNFYSLFASKPFGASGEGRWNNIFMFEEGGGKWNRFDVEYGFDDQLIGTFEVNKYFGDNDTMFGQFENASNIQIGVKYLLQ